jgi:hypothetical protein
MSRHLTRGSDKVSSWAPLTLMLALDLHQLLLQSMNGIRTPNPVA